MRAPNTLTDLRPKHQITDETATLNNLWLVQLFRTHLNEVETDVTAIVRTQHGLNTVDRIVQITISSGLTGGFVEMAFIVKIQFY